MDYTEKILKFANLGWEGKEDITEFLQRKYNITYKISKLLEYDQPPTLISIKFENYGEIYSHKVILPSTADLDPIKYCLRLFITHNGVLSGPSFENFFGEEREWT